MFGPIEHVIILGQAREVLILVLLQPLLEVGSPLMILPDHNLNSTFPVFALCGDGLQPRGQNEKQILDDQISAYKHPAPITKVTSDGFLGQKIPMLLSN